MRLADTVPDSHELTAIAAELEDEALNLFIQEGEKVLPLTDAMFDNARNLRSVAITKA